MGVAKKIKTAYNEVKKGTKRAFKGEPFTDEEMAVIEQKIDNTTKKIENKANNIIDTTYNTGSRVASNAKDMYANRDREKNKRAISKYVRLNEHNTPKLTKRSMAIAAVPATYAAISGGFETAEENKMGRNNPYSGGVFKATPSIYQNTSATRHAYDNGSGATGDLVFAMHQNRRG